MFVAETAVAGEQGGGSAYAQEDEIAFETFFGDGRAGFKRGENGSFRLREAEAGFDQRIGDERGVDGEQKLLETGVFERGHGDGVAVAGELGKLAWRHQIDLVENLDDVLFGNVELGEDLFYLQFLLVADGAGGVLHVEQDFGAFDFFKRGAKAGDEGVGQVADESDGIRQQDFAARGKLELAQLGVERGEHAGGLEHARLGEGVEQCAFAGVGVADERDDRDGHGLATLALLVADAADALELGLDVAEAMVDLAAIGFELGFTRAAGADAAAKLGHGAAASGEARELVLELGELDLELALAGAGVAGEDVEDELRAIDDVAGQAGFDVAKLRRGKVVIEQDERRVGAGDGADDFFDFAFADEARGVGFLPALDERGDDGGTGRAGELFELGAAGGEVEGGRGLVELVFVAGYHRGGGAGKAGGGGKLLALAQLAGELDDDQDGELLLGLRGAELAGEEGGVLRGAGLGEAAAGGFGAGAAGGPGLLLCCRVAWFRWATSDFLWCYGWDARRGPDGLPPRTLDLKSSKD